MYFAQLINAAEGCTFGHPWSRSGVNDLQTTCVSGTGKFWGSKEAAMYSSHVISILPCLCWMLLERLHSRAAHPTFIPTLVLEMLTLRHTCLTFIIWYSKQSFILILLFVGWQPSAEMVAERDLVWQFQLKMYENVVK